MTMFQKLIGVFFALVLIAGCSSSKEKGNESAVSEGNSTSISMPTAGVNEASELRAMVERLGNVVYFGFDQSNITPESEEVLNAHSKLLKSTGASVVLEGNTDDRGTREYNMALGERRGKSVADYMVMQGVAPSQLEVVSFGKERPAVQGNDEAAWAKNRRVEIVSH
jgi:peptidoglycan-associated lipoprotein